MKISEVNHHKGKNLSRTNFSEADIRGANFTNAILRDADFRGVKVQLFWVTIALILLGISGFVTVIYGNYVTDLLIIAADQSTGRIRAKFQK